MVFGLGPDFPFKFILAHCAQPLNNNKESMILSDWHIIKNNPTSSKLLKITDFIQQTIDPRPQFLYFLPSNLGQIWILTHHTHTVLYDVLC